MKRLLCIALLCAAGCSAAPVVTPPVVQEEETGGSGGIQDWIPGVFDDLWETMDARIGIDYPFGAHLKFTDLARIGIFDYADFSVIGVESDVFHGGYHFPDLRAWNNNGSWDLAFKFGVGFGMEASLHTWEVIDFFSSLVGLGYWSLDED